MRIELEMVEVEGSVFVSGTNLGPKIDTKHKGGCELYYDTEKEMTFIIHKGKTWMGKVKGMILKDDKPSIPISLSHKVYEAPTEPVKAQATGPEKTVRTAQVSTPMDKVQGGIKKRAKYQGEEA